VWTFNPKTTIFIGEKSYEGKAKVNDGEDGHPRG
jgi:hypothetical protein